jgi:tetratricopeptide (TPR) repeat protein
VVPTRISLHNNLGVMLKRVGRDREALESFRSVLSLDAASFEARANLVGLLSSSRSSLGGPSDAVAEARVLVRMHGGDAFAHTHPQRVATARRALATALFRIGAFAEALDALAPRSDQATAKATAKAKARGASAATEEGNGEDDNHPPNPLVDRMLDTDRGIVLAKLGRHKEAAASYRRGISAQQNPSSSSPANSPLTAAQRKARHRAMSNLAFALRELGQGGASKRMSERALELDPTDALSLNNLAELHHAVGELDEAVARYVQALKIKPNDPAMWKGVAQIEFERAGLPSPDSASSTSSASSSASSFARIDHRRRRGYEKAKRGLGESLVLRLPPPSTECKQWRLVPDWPEGSQEPEGPEGTEGEGTFKKGRPPEVTDKEKEALEKKSGMKKTINVAAPPISAMTTVVDITAELAAPPLRAKAKEVGQGEEGGGDKHNDAYEDAYGRDHDRAVFLVRLRDVSIQFPGPVLFQKQRSTTGNTCSILLGGHGLLSALQTTSALTPPPLLPLLPLLPQTNETPPPPPPPSPSPSPSPSSSSSGDYVRGSVTVLTGPVASVMIGESLRVILRVILLVSTKNYTKLY